MGGTMTEQQEKYNHSVEVLRLAAKMSEQYYNKPLLITYSGGKDSDVMLRIAEESGINYEVQNSHTTVDAPETVYHIRDVIQRQRDKGHNAEIVHAKYKDGTTATMWNLIQRKGIPHTRTALYCCVVLKEQTTPNRLITVGVREAESIKRRGRNDFETRGGKISKPFIEMLEVYEEAQENDPVFDCQMITKAKQNNDIVVNPVYYWNDADIWDFIHDREINTNPLYCRGYNRVGCIGCPLSGAKKQIRDFNDYPKFKQAYIRAFDKLVNFSFYDYAGGDTKSRGEKIFDWWIQAPEYGGQLTFDNMEIKNG